MAELIVLLGLASPFLLMIWLWRARKSAQAKVDAQTRAEEPVRNRFETEDVLSEEGGLRAGRRNLSDGDTEEADSTGGEPAGIRSLQGRR
jgi:hypothetical protein